LEIADCVIRNFNEGISLLEENGLSSVYVSNTIVTGGLVEGITVDAQNPMIVSLSDVTIFNNDVGILIGTNPNVEMMISDSHINNNIRIGVSTQGGGLFLYNTSINQTPTGIDVTGSSNVWLSQVTEAAVGGFPNNGGVVFDNELVGTQHVYSDKTNRLAGVTGGTLEAWSRQ